MGGQGINEARFVECFGKGTASFIKEEVDEENLLSGIQ